MGPTPNEESVAANGAATRALINEELMRSPRHRHAFARQPTVVGRLCVTCGRRIWQNGCRCLLCGSTVHRGCQARVRLCTWRGAAPAVVAPSAEWDEYDVRRASANAVKYISVQKLASTRAGARALKGVLPATVWTVAAQRSRRATWEASALEREAAKVRAKRPPGSGKLSVLYDLATAAKHSRLVAERLVTTEGPSSRKLRFGLWAGAAAAGTVAGGVAGSALAGPAGALLGAKLAQAAVASGATASNVGALVGGATISYRQRHLLSASPGAKQASRRAIAHQRRLVAASVAARALGGPVDEPFAAAAAAATARADLDSMALEFDDERLAAEIVRRDSTLEAQVERFVDATLAAETLPARVHHALAQLPCRTVDDVISLIRATSIAIVAYHSALAERADALEAAFNQVDRAMLATHYDLVMAALDEPENDAKLQSAADDASQTLAAKTNRAHFNVAVRALRALQDHRAPNDKLRHLVLAVEALARVPDDANDDCDADLLLPLAVDAVRAAALPHLHAHLNLIETLGRDDGLGVQGYALTTLRCAIALLIRRTHHHASPAGGDG